MLYRVSKKGKRSIVLTSLFENFHQIKKKKSSDRILSSEKKRIRRSLKLVE